MTKEKKESSDGQPTRIQYILLGICEQISHELNVKLLYLPEGGGLHLILAFPPKSHYNNCLYILDFILYRSTEYISWCMFFFSCLFFFFEDTCIRKKENTVLYTMPVQPM